ncbi:MAG TPA: VWA domain-containing protein [Kiritimatiellia bacterium]|nr:VWA domain-containing protein [Kiritimatiellia bacterium]HPS08344.1 VWA domain-containing protein [Kiritimatiellia bacterium]
MLSFATPLAFLLLLPWAVAAWRLYRTGQRAGVLFAPTHRLPAKTAGWRVALARTVPLLFLSGSLLLILAAARPRTALARERRSVNAIAIGMVVDVSGSMEALDLSPSQQAWKTRLDVVKEMFARFVEARPDDLIGLVTFGGYASTRAPLTADHRALVHVLKGVEIPRSQTDAQGRPVDQEETLTAIGDGLATGVARLTDAEPKTRIIILLSDGESNTGIITPDQAADAAAKIGVRVYAIGVGSNNRTPFKTRDLFGRETIAYADATFDETQLKAIASKTSGRYFSVRDNEGLKKALEEINALETTKIDRQVYQRFDEHFVRFLLWGAALAALALTLNMNLTRRLL